MLNPRWPPKLRHNYRIGVILKSVGSRNIIPDSTHMLWGLMNADLELFFILTFKMAA